MHNVRNSCFCLFLFCALTLLMMSSCYSRIEGCLIPEAANFDVTADDACADCCIYPKFLINVRHLTGDKLINANDTLINNFNQQYKILSFVYYLSGFKAIRDDGSKITIEESISFDAGANIIETPDDFGIWRLSKTRQELGTVSKYGKFTGLSFYLGVEDNWQIYEPLNLPITHVLTDSLSLKTSDGTLAHQIIRIAKGENFMDTVDYSVKGLSGAVAYQLDTTSVFHIGMNINFTLRADYSKWFKNINLDQNVSMIENQLKENSKGIFNVR